MGTPEHFNRLVRSGVPNSVNGEMSADNGDCDTRLVVVRLVVGKDAVTPVTVESWQHLECGPRSNIIIVRP